MKTIKLFGLAFLSVLYGVVFSACKGGDDNGGKNKEKEYYYQLLYAEDGKNEKDPEIDWEGSSSSSRLQIYFENFENDYPEGADWYLECNEPWVKIGLNHGRITYVREFTNIKIEENDSYETRKATVFLNIPSINPNNNLRTTVRITQWGYEYYLGSQMLFIRTNLSKANSKIFTLNNFSFYDDLFEIAWGDGEKTLLTKKDRFSTLSHEYKSNGEFKICIRFSKREGMGLSFTLAKGQGVESVGWEKSSWDYRSYSSPGDSYNAYVSYSENNGLKVSFYN